MQFLNAINWETTATIVTIVAALLGGAAWLINRIFKFGKLAQRLVTVEGDITEIKKDLKESRQALKKSIDDAIILINQNQNELNKLPSPHQLTAEKGQK